VTVIGLEAAVPVIELGDEVAVLVEIAAPPVSPAVNVTVACAFPPVADPIVGASGTVVAVIEPEAAEAAEDPAAFVATTVKV
jgi:hypothetical protein